MYFRSMTAVFKPFFAIVQATYLPASPLPRTRRSYSSGCEFVVFTVANIYTGPNLEDTAVIVEASAFHDGIVVVQVNEIVGPSLDAIGRALKSSN
jgi:hypothetical protein